MFRPFLLWTLFLASTFREGVSKSINITQSLKDLSQRELELKITIRLDGHANGKDSVKYLNTWGYDDDGINQDPSEVRIYHDGKSKSGNPGVKALKIQRGVLKYPSNPKAMNNFNKVKVPLPDTTGQVRFPPKQSGNNPFMMFHGKRSVRGHFHKRGMKLLNIPQRLHKRSIAPPTEPREKAADDEQPTEKAFKALKRSYWRNSIHTSPYYGWKRMDSHWNWYGYRVHGHSLDTLASNIIGKRST